MAVKSLVENKYELSIARGIGIILVVVAHVSSNTWLNRCIYLFHMPFFFLISGMLFKNLDPLYYLRSKAKALLIPFFCIYRAYNFC